MWASLFSAPLFNHAQVGRYDGGLSCHMRNKCQLNLEITPLEVLLGISTYKLFNVPPEFDKCKIFCIICQKFVLYTIVSYFNRHPSSLRLPNSLTTHQWALSIICFPLCVLDVHVPSKKCPEVAFVPLVHCPSLLGMFLCLRL